MVFFLFYIYYDYHIFNQINRWTKLSYPIMGYGGFPFCIDTKGGEIGRAHV